MPRRKVFTEEQIKANRTRQNIANYNRILASQSDNKRFNKSIETIERYLLGVEKLNKTREFKIMIDTSKMESILRKAKQINLAIKIEADVRKIMATESRSAESGGEKVHETALVDSKMSVADSATEMIEK
jgi:hypothetical protein